MASQSNCKISTVVWESNPISTELTRLVCPTGYAIASIRWLYWQAEGTVVKTQIQP